MNSQNSEWAEFLKNRGPILHYYYYPISSFYLKSAKIVFYRVDVEIISVLTCIAIY